MIKRCIVASMLAGFMAWAAPATAQDAKVPYWASIRASEVNMRAGPGEDYRISWVYRRPQLPIKVLRLKEGWRLVQDPDGAQGWMMARFLTRQRGGYIKGAGTAAMRDSAEPGAKLLWRLEPGVTGLLGECANGWCAFSIGERKGFVEQARVWGAGEP
ncbi:SH3 domain-containing protein [Novosphingobium sp.]|uniref:SH3 domain-containing protein n=1 Tax=Novosphingobium sp. TaxID=1874826 RepID=UPI0027325808|nr:SH3 domain-containing protein [Novosphingobium sp.]MDP3906065.1 SH3 domain-containing protein [Novosphingobium sp.]